MSTALTDQGLTCIYRAFAWAVRSANPSMPIYRYVFTHGRTNNPPHESAYHRSELGFLFGDIAIEADGPYVPTVAELELSEAMMMYWCRFAATGDPNGPGTPGWQPTDSTAEPLLRIETGELLGMTPAYHQRQCDYLWPVPF